MHRHQPPRYEFPRRHLVTFAIDLLLGRQRSFAADSRLVMAANTYSRRIEGQEEVPSEGSFVLVMNHYNREGLRPYHCAMVVSAALSDRRRGQPEVRWVFTSELLGRRIGPFPIPLWLVRWTFRRIAHVYSLVVMPRREQLTTGRAAALRRVAQALKASPVGITPEARGSGRLVEPPRGSGLFLASLAGTSAPLVPVAVFEDGETLIIRFGRPFQLSLPEDAPRRQCDGLAQQQVMVAIGELLPADHWGAYADAIRKER